MQFDLNGQQVEVDETGLTLAEVLRDSLGVTSVKDGCSPQGQCGCCTVLVDGEPRVSCVTPARRVSERSVLTLEGLGESVINEWATALCATGGSQCGFCTPGIIVRLEGNRRRGADLASRSEVDRSLAAHLCRCTGWQTIVEAAARIGSAPGGGAGGTATAHHAGSDQRDLATASQRATIEGGAPQRVDPEVALGRGGFADDTAPPGTAVAVRRGGAGPDDGSIDGTGDRWVTGPTLSDARRAAGKVQGRRSTAEPAAPIELPAGDWSVTLQTGWVDPAYLETDASWAAPEAEASGPLANGGAFGAKRRSPLPPVAAELARATQGPVRARWSREDTLRWGPKRPPVAIGLAADGSGTVVVARTPGIVDQIRRVVPDWEVTEVDVAGPPTTSDVRGAGWAEVAAVVAAGRSSGDGTVTVTSPDGAVAEVRIGSGDGSGSEAGPRIDVSVRCGEVLDQVTLRSYCIGAVHMALGWVTSESLAVDDDGEVLSLTLRSLGIVRPGDMVPVTVEVIDEPGVEPVCGSDAVFAATAAAVWRWQGLPPRWPTGRALDAEAVSPASATDRGE